LEAAEESVLASRGMPPACVEEGVRVEGAVVAVVDGGGGRGRCGWWRWWLWTVSCVEAWHKQRDVETHGPPKAGAGRTLAMAVLIVSDLYASWVMAETAFSIARRELL
jgi:hypothetical protein